MKINRLETHDRLLHLKQDQALNIFKGADVCLKKNELSLALQEKSPYVYLHAHPRTSDDGLRKRMLWHPRLSKPPAETNSYLFRAISKTDIIEICWMIPERCQWDEYKMGNVTESEIVNWSIQQFQFNRAQLEAPEKDDLTDERGAHIYRSVISEHIQKKRMDKIWAMPGS